MISEEKIYGKKRYIFLTVGILIGLIGAYCLLIGFLSAFDGMFQNFNANVTLSINESRLVEEMNKTIIQNNLKP